MIAHLRRGGRVLVGENGYFMPDGRRRWTFGIDGTNGRGRHLPVNGDPARRAALGLPLGPWRGDGTNIIILGQRGVRTNTPAISHDQAWPDRIVVDVARAFPDSTIRYRPHPGRCEAFPSRAIAAGRATLTDPTRPLAEDLDAATLAVGYCSTALVEAVWRGIPAVYTAPTAIVAGVAATSVAGVRAYGPSRPDRSAWADRIASWQWTDDELAEGWPLRPLLPCA